MARFYILSIFFAAIYAVEGHELYNDELETCCSGSLHAGSESSTSCCGSNPYNYDKKFCCSDILVDIPEHLQGNDELRYHYGCCYSEDKTEAAIYNGTTHQCCDGEAIKKDDPEQYYGCCNGKLFDHSLEICCGNQLQDRNIECCGDQEPYDSSTHVCCSSYERQPDGEYDWVYELHENDESTNEICCGLELYDHTQKVCCHNTNEVRDKPSDAAEDDYVECCGDKLIIDHKSQVCHNNEVRERPADGYSICGKEQFNYESQSCCNDVVVYDDDSGLSCCYEANATYNSETEACSGGKVRPITSPDNGYCGDLEYNYSRQSCCFENDIFDDDSKIRCCHSANQTYNIENQACCGEKVITLTEEDISKNMTSCCY